jgi:hypothetical protein
MTRVLVWKELREQWNSAVAVLALGVCLFVSSLMLSNASGPRFELTTGLLLCLAWVCGLVAGVQPLATEFESGTLNWLDALPVSRRAIWRSKALAAAGIVVAQVILLFALMLAISGRDPLNHPVRVLAIAMLFGLSGLAGGLLGSALARTALGAFGWGILIQFGVGWILAIFASAWSVGMGQSSFADVLFAALALVTSAAPLVISARRFGRLDRMRRARNRDRTPVSERRAIAWLTWRQGRVVRWVVLGAGLSLAISVPLAVPHLWPAFGLLLGVIAGAGTFGADQAGTACRFLGDRRIQPGKLWAMKQLVRIGPLAVVVVAYFLFGWMRILAIQWDLAHVSQAGDPDRIDRLMRDFNPTLVLIGPLYGYALGQFFGLVCRKEAVAAVLAALTAACVWFLWTPSLVIGGVFLWQWLLPPLLLIAVTRPAIWPWATGRLATWTPILGLGAAVLVAIALSLGGVAYRMIEAPVRSAPFDVAAFETTLPKPEQNEAGREIAQSIRQFQKAFDQAEADFGQNVQRPNDTSPAFIVQAGDAVRDAKWPTDNAKLDRWLDAILAERWLEEIRAAVRLPLGSVNLTGVTYSHVNWQIQVAAQNAGTLIEARALRRISRGEVETALDDIGLALDLSRHLQSKTRTDQFISAASMETRALVLLPKWAVKAADRPELIRRAIDMVRDHEEHRPPLSDVIKKEYLNSLQNAQYGYRIDMIPPGGRPNGLEWQLREAAINTPWEQIRTDAILATWFAGILRTAEMSYPEAIRRIDMASPNEVDAAWYLLSDWVPPTSDPSTARRDGRRLVEMLRNSVWWNMGWGMGSYLFALDARSITVIRATQYQLALILYQARFGKPAETVQVLVPDFLPSPPVDPFGDGPFHYRVSVGERIHWFSNRPYNEDSAYRTFGTGEGILWSNGPDLHDDGGRRNELSAWRFQGGGPAPGGDILFIVPVVGRR